MRLICWEAGTDWPDNPRSRTVDPEGLVLLHRSALPRCTRAARIDQATGLDSACLAGLDAGMSFIAPNPKVYCADTLCFFWAHGGVGFTAPSLLQDSFSTEEAGGWRASASTTVVAGSTTTRIIMTMVASRSPAAEKNP